MQILVIVLVTLGFAALLAFILGAALGMFRDLFAVERNPLIDRVKAALPGVNCGACGYSGCEAYAVAIVERAEKAILCTSGGSKTAEAVGALMGVSADAEDMVALLRCQGTRDKAFVKGDYAGVKSCRAAKIATGGIKLCPWGCMGFGDCVAVCAFDALGMGPDGLPAIDYSKCTGCGMCKDECPQGLFIKVKKDKRAGAVALCSNRAQVKQTVNKACKAGCIKCELCVKACPKSAIKMDRGLPIVDYDLCDSCGICVQRCPTKVLALLEQIEK
jgi:Na+-translocating ferredoxin:NAD+ oxidoreductase subunit B